MEAVKEGRLIIVRVPLEGGGRLVVSVNDAEAKELHDALASVVASVLITTRTGPRGGPFCVCRRAVPSRRECGLRTSLVIWSRPSPAGESALTHGAGCGGLGDERAEAGGDVVALRRVGDATLPERVGDEHGAAGRARRRPCSTYSMTDCGSASMKTMS